MATFGYCAKLECSKTGAFIAEIDCDVEIQHEPERGFEIVSIRVDGKNICRGDKLATFIASEIEDQVDSELRNSRGEFFATVTDRLNREREAA